ncbi:hypothetical protein LL253_07855 [Sphingobium soli]|uniref:Uncharacterized protein n=1 Tax=Sphingobium soli TaxID=1591116 RepID=A0ABS8H2L5_9SPHN|nr:hypothetical protein [Sphingobium soli]MCC4232603.1 hypothetical protein [Sphingobium soli]
MNFTDLSTAGPEQPAPALLAALQRLGELGRDGAVALARLVADDDGAFDEAADWIADIASGGLHE